jgi:hypothetical protein
VTVAFIIVSLLASYPCYCEIRAKDENIIKTYR